MPRLGMTDIGCLILHAFGFKPLRCRLFFHHAADDRPILRDDLADPRFHLRTQTLIAADPVKLTIQPFIKAVLYPLQTFTKGRRVDFSEIPVFLTSLYAVLTLGMLFFFFKNAPFLFFQKIKPPPRTTAAIIR